MPRYNSLTPLPRVPDPTESANSLLALATNLERYQGARQQNQAAQASQLAVQEALTHAQGDPSAAADHLEGVGRWSEATALREQASEIRAAQQEEIVNGFKRQREGFETATRYLQSIEATPEERRAEVYGQYRPQLLEALPEGLREFLPEQYDPAVLETGIPLGLTAAQAASRREQAVTTLNKRLSNAKNQHEMDTASLEALATFAEHANDSADFRTYIETLERTYQASPVIRHAVGDVPDGEWDDATREQVAERLRAASDPDLPSSIEQAVLRAYESGNPETVTGLVGLAGRLSAARRTPTGSEAVNPVEVQALLDNPEIWGDITPSKRDAMLGTLAQQGFDFGAAARAMTPSQRATIERWKADQLTELDRALREGELGAVEEEQAIYSREKARIEDSYRVQIGEGQARRTASPTTADRVERNRQSVLPAERGGVPRTQTPEAILRRLGDRPHETAEDGRPIVTLKDGRRLIVDSIDSQGTIRGTPAP